MILRAAWLVALLSLLAPSAGATEPTADELLNSSRAAYAKLTSYEDVGTIETQDRSIGSTMIVERHTFTTRFAPPRRFYFEFKKTPEPDGERFVIWNTGTAFNSWWSPTQVAETYAPGEGANAFAIGELPTVGTALLIPPLFFPGSGLQGPLMKFETPARKASEKLNGRVHHVLTANVRLNHWSEATRLTTIWLDAETLLISKIIEDTPTGMGSGVVQRATTTFAPKANGKIAEAQFKFSPP
ncbi:MAG: hypothetical protein K8S25_10415 [Alphaproteobacteria bacterium]|nr:hypothetical protein [Alphaproteobacteria bacterium]